MEGSLALVTAVLAFSLALAVAAVFTVIVIVVMTGRPLETS
jgi:hypothetical protein